MFSAATRSPRRAHAESASVKVVLSGRAAGGRARKTRSAVPGDPPRECATRSAFQAAIEEGVAGEVARVDSAASSAPARA